jgi:hypothetical protein
MADHAARSTPEHSPALHEFLSMDVAERWSERSPEVMLETFHWYRGEGFGLIVEETAQLGLPAIEVETSMAENDLVERVARAFAL